MNTRNICIRLRTAVLCLLLLCLTAAVDAQTHRSPSWNKSAKLQLRTNGLYYLAASPNVGLEVQTEYGLAWQLDFVGAWWNDNARKNFWSNYMFQTEIRYYLSAKESVIPCKGHHVGVYGQMATYDFKLGNMGVICPDLEKTWAVGVSYGYSLGLNQKLALDFTAGIGYLNARFDKYVPNTDGMGWKRISTNTFRAFLPSKIEVSLVWNINGRYQMNRDKHHIVF